MLTFLEMHPEISGELEARRAEAFVVSERAREGQREEERAAAARLLGLKDMLESPEKGLVALNRRMMHLLEDFECENGDGKSGGTGLGEEQSRAVQWRAIESELAILGGAVVGGAMESDAQHCSDGGRVEHLKAEIGALSVTRDQLLTETEGLLAEVAALWQVRVTSCRGGIERRRCQLLRRRCDARNMDTRERGRV